MARDVALAYKTVPLLLRGELSNFEFGIAGAFMKAS
jgi:hypothetical protein